MTRRGRLRGVEEVGTFTAAYRVIAVLVAVVGTVSGVLYPRFSQLFAADPEGFGAAVGRAREDLLGGGAPPRVGPPPRPLLAWVIPLFRPPSPLSSAMLAMGAERTWLWLLGAATGVVIGGGWLLIPPPGHRGVGAAALPPAVFLGAT